MEPQVIDVRRVAPPQRHPLIFQTFEELADGASFVLVNDHEPRPLFYHFSMKRTCQFT